MFKLKFALVASCAMAMAGNSYAQSLDTKRMAEVAQNYVDNGSYMGAVLVAQDGHIVLSRGFGDADLEWNIENTPDTRFRIGSITKQFTAACVLLLEQQGKLKIADPMKTYLPETPAAWDKVTVENLLHHTSGVPNYTGSKNFNTYERSAHTPQESVALVRNMALDFVPGSKFIYSNTNYVLLGEIVEKVSGMTLEQFLQQNIFTPLDMKNTGVDKNSAVLPRRAQGYDPAPNGVQRAGYIDMSVPYGAGYLYSTVGDLAKWEAALYSGKLLDATELAKMTTPGPGGYGMGIFVGDVDGHRDYGHDGTIQGFAGELMYYPETKLAIAVLGNVRTEAPDKIAVQIAKVAFGEKFILNSDRKVVPVDAATLAQYSGHYSAPPFSLTVSAEGGRLIATTPNGRKYVMWPESAKNFFVKEVDVQIEFERDASGKVIGFKMTQDGNAKDVEKDR